MKKMFLVGLIGMAAVTALVGCMTVGKKAFRGNRGETETVLEILDESVEATIEAEKIEESTEAETEESTEVETESVVEEVTEEAIEEVTEETTEDATEESTRAVIEEKEETTTEKTTEKETEKETSKPGEGYIGSVGTFSTEVGVVIGGTTIVYYPTTEKKEKEPLTLEEKLLVDEMADENGEYKYNGYTERISYYSDEIMAAKNKWIKENFGTSFTFNGIEFKWSEENQLYFWVQIERKLYYMTSTTTYRDEYCCHEYYSYRIADYLGFYGTDSARYLSEDSLYDRIMLWNYDPYFATVTDICENNLKYLLQLGWTQVYDEGDVEKDWSLESPEGVPANLCGDGRIALYMVYPGEKETTYYFTINEFNEFLNNNEWRIGTRTGARGWAFEAEEDLQKYIRKYVIVG